MGKATEVVVVGGGFSGLFIANRLAAAGRDVVLLESAEHPGGIAQSILEDGFLLEPAVGTFMLPHRALTPILASGGVAVEEASPAASMRYVWTGEQLIGIPYGPQALLSRAVSVRGKLRMAAEPFLPARPDPAGEESLQAFLTRRLGAEAGGLLAHLAASGVYAGDPAVMSAAATFPLFAEMEAEAGSILRGAVRRLRSLPKPRPPKPKSHVPAGGMMAAATTLAASLGDRYRGSSPVVSVSRERDLFRVESSEAISARSLVLAARPEVAVKLLSDVDPGLPTGWPSSPVAVVGIGGTEDEVPLPNGFGFLTGPGVDAVTRGCLFESSYGPSRAGPGRSLAKVIVGGTRNPAIVDRPDEEITAAVLAELERALGATVSPSWVRVVRHRDGIPQYDLAHRRRLAAVKQLEAEHPGLMLAGWGYRGIGVAHLATEAVAVVERVEQLLFERAL